MGKNTQIQDHPECKAALAQFSAWRAGRKPHSRIPTNLWALAVEIAQKHGVAQAAVLLQLNYSDLKKRLSGPPKVKKKRSPFVALDMPAPAHPQEYNLEFENRRGDKMKITMKGIQPADLTGIAKGFWRK